jgi:hypothetical protein
VATVHDATLLAAAKELRDACAAAMRVMVDPMITPKGVLDAWLSELQAIGIADGLGRRADEAIAAAMKSDEQDCA